MVTEGSGVSQAKSVSAAGRRSAAADGRFAFLRSLLTSRESSGLGIKPIEAASLGKTPGEINNAATAYPTGPKARERKQVISRSSRRILIRAYLLPRWFSA
jgi:hypothetical protein